MASNPQPSNPPPQPSPLRRGAALLALAGSIRYPGSLSPEAIERSLDERGERHR